MVGCAKLGMNFTACAPEVYFPDQALIDTCQAIAAETDTELCFETDPMKAVQGADVLYTDVWVSMANRGRSGRNGSLRCPHIASRKELMDAANPGAVFMHCLPAFHDLKTTIGKEMGEKFGRTCMEVTDEVFESPQSIVFREAENRMHTIKAVMAATL